jgi:serine kinase of HPr protein (carbohydrate metabolism regulator)
MAPPVNVHATAIRINQTGLMFAGPSGWGKSILAFTCLTEAQRLGLPAVLVADDQVFVEHRDGNIIAKRPDSIGGLIELRGTGIVSLDSIPEAVMHFAILPASVSGSDRLPHENERIELAEGYALPVIRLLANTAVPLAILMAKAPEIGM